LLFTATTLLVACDSQNLTELDATASTTVTLSASDVVLDILNSGQDALTVTWTEPSFGYKAAPSYKIILSYQDNSETVPVGTNLSKTFETVELNKILINLGLTPKIAGEISIKVEVSLSDYSSFDSNDMPITVTPFSTDFNPIYMIGDAVLGWDTAKAVEVYGTGPGTYEVIAKFNNGGAFRFFDAPDWNASSQYNWTFFEGGSVDANFENAQDGDTNIKFIGTTGFYKIDVNLITKTIIMNAVDEPKHYMVGAGIPDAGWGWDTPVEMTWVKDGVFEATTTFSNDTFRFFTNFGDWGSGRNYPYYVGEGFTIDSNFEDAQDGDNNFRFLGTPGVYTITVNYLDKTITLSPTT